MINDKRQMENDKGLGGTEAFFGRVEPADKSEDGLLQADY